MQTRVVRLFTCKLMPVLAAGCLLCCWSSNTGMAKSNQAFEHWKEQEDWAQFTDKEQSGSTKSVQPTTNGNKTKSGAASQLPTAANSESSGNFIIPGYVMSRPPATAPTAPIEHRETTIYPVLRSNYPAYTQPGSWNGYGANLRPYGPYYSSSSWRGRSPVVGFRQVTKVIQTAPSRSSGNYYNAATADPSAAGSYYAAPANAPVAMPILQQAPAQKDYWGSAGSPFAK